MPSQRSALVVEDEWLLRLELAQELSSAGWTIQEAATGEDALKILSLYQARGETIDLLVTDVRLGGAVEGWDVAEACRKLWPGLPVIYVTANSVREDGRVEGSATLSKPVEVELLLSTGRKLIAGRP